MAEGTQGMHEEPLKQCAEIQCRMQNQIEKHIEESVNYRNMATKHDQQITTILAAQLSFSADVKEIFRAIADIRVAQTNIQNGMIISEQRIRIWILTAAVSGLVVLLGTALYYGGDKKQIEVDGKRIEMIEMKLDKHMEIPVK